MSHEGADQNAEIEAGDMDQIALGDVFAAPKPDPAHAAVIERMREAALDIRKSARTPKSQWDRNGTYRSSFRRSRSDAKLMAGPDASPSPSTYAQAHVIPGLRERSVPLDRHATDRPWRRDRARSRAAASRARRERDRRRASRSPPVVADLVIAQLLALGRGVLQAIERALAGERSGFVQRAIEFAEQHAENWIAPQLVMVEQVLVAERQAEHALRHKCFNLVDDIDRIALIPKAGGKALDQGNRLVGLTEQQGAGVGGHHPAVEIRHDATAADPSKIDLARATLRLHRGAPSNQRNLFFAKQVYAVRGPDAPQVREKSGLASC